VLIRSVIAGTSTYAPSESLSLPKGMSRLQLDYTATTLSVPERTRFVYRLAGVDSGWIDAGSRREAFYTNLAPGHYRFEVAAANEDGIWSQRPATLSFDIAPTFLQSGWFIATCVVLGAAVLWPLYRLRLHQVTTKLHRSMEERNAERERIARDLHDTFLQGVQGLILRFQSIIYEMPEGAENRRVMEASLEQARGVVADGRDRVSALRSRTGRTDLSGMLEEAARRLAQGGRIGITTIVTGQVRPLDPGASDEINMICDEALFNAAQHARASRITIALEYARRRLTVTIADDGVGIEQAVLQHGRKGHFGLVGMRERARRLGASLAIVSMPGQGTRIILAIPANAAYAHASTWRLRARRPDMADRV
jgi:signal transduction histidine kinase